MVGLASEAEGHRFDPCRAHHILLPALTRLVADNKLPTKNHYSIRACALACI